MQARTNVTEPFMVLLFILWIHNEKNSAMQENRKGRGRGTRVGLGALGVDVRLRGELVLDDRGGLLQLGHVEARDSSDRWAIHGD